jgi:Rod binding domain-containing protein
MTGPLAPGPGVSPPSPLSLERRTGTGGELTARSTPDRRVAPVDRSRADPELLKAAESMEGMFLDYMMQVMRQSVPESDLSLSNPAVKIYQGMLDSEAAQTAVRAGGVGLADQIIAWQEASRYNGMREQAAPAPRQEGAVSTGGTHEGQSPAR